MNNQDGSIVVCDIINGAQMCLINITRWDINKVWEKPSYIIVRIKY